MGKINWNNPEEVKELRHIRYINEREKVLEQNKQWREDNPEYDKQYRIEHKKEHNKWQKGYRNTTIGRAFSLLGNYKRNDKKYNRGDCTLTAQWIVDNIFTKCCVHCGENDWHKLGCNRLDNSKPHTPDNVEPCCGSCNYRLPKK